MPHPRIPLESEKVYHIWTHANGSENLFRSDDNYRYFLEKYIVHVFPVVETFAYCLMPNHLHLMIRVRNEQTVLDFLRLKKPTLQGFGTLGGFSKVISLQFSHLFNGYTQAYNKKFDRKGSLFNPNFNRNLVDSDKYFTALIAYIHNNPIHHGFVTDLKDWRHSSWHTYLLNKPTHLAREEGLAWFGSKKEFIKIHREFETKDIMLEFEV